MSAQSGVAAQKLGACTVKQGTSPYADLPMARRKLAPDTPSLGSAFKKAALENIPPRDLPFGVPNWMGTGDMA